MLCKNLVCRSPPTRTLLTSLRQIRYYGIWSSNDGSLNAVFFISFLPEMGEDGAPPTSFSTYQLKILFCQPCIYEVLPLQSYFPLPHPASSPSPTFLKHTVTCLSAKCMLMHPRMGGGEGTIALKKPENTLKSTQNFQLEQKVPI